MSSFVYGELGCGLFVFGEKVANLALSPESAGAYFVLSEVVGMDGRGPTKLVRGARMGGGVELKKSQRLTGQSGTLPWS